MPTALVLTSDLFFSSRIAGAASAAGLTLTTAGDAEKLLALATENQAVLVLLDLTSPACRPEELVSALRAATPQLAILAFGPHVQTARLEAARAAGCDEVFTRGQFDRQLNALLAQYADA